MHAMTTKAPRLIPTMSQVITGNVPFDFLNTPLGIVRAVIGNKRPICHPMSRGMEDFVNLWHLATACWAEDPANRPSLRELTSGDHCFEGASEVSAMRSKR